MKEKDESDDFIFFTFIFVGNCGLGKVFSFENKWKSVGINSFGVGKWSSGISSHVSHFWISSLGKYSCLYCVPNHFSFSVAIETNSLLVRNTLELFQKFVFR